MTMTPEITNINPKNIADTMARLRKCYLTGAADMLESLAARLEEVEAERDAARTSLMNAGIALHVSKREAEAAVAEVARLRTAQGLNIDAALDAMESNMRAEGQMPLDWRKDLTPEDQDKLRACVRAGIVAAIAQETKT
jgi:hypothetical protein